MLFLTVLPFEAVEEHQGFPFLYLSCLCGKYSIQINNFRLHLEKGNVTSKMAAFMNIVRRSFFNPNEDARSMHRKKSIDEKKSEVLVTFRNKAICGLAGIMVWQEHHDFYGYKESVRLQGCMPAPGLGFTIMGVRQPPKSGVFGGNLEFGVVDFPGQICGNVPNRVHRLRHNQRESRQSEYHIVSATPESVCTELGFCEIGLWDWNSSFSRT